MGSEGNLAVQLLKNTHRLCPPFSCSVHPFRTTRTDHYRIPPPLHPPFSCFLLSPATMVSFLLRRPILLAAMTTALVMLLGASGSVDAIRGGTLERASASSVSGAASRAVAATTIGDGDGAVSVDQTLQVVWFRQAVDVLKINAAIKEVARTSPDRGSFTRSSVVRAAGILLRDGRSIGSVYNVLIFNREVRQKHALNQVVYRQAFGSAGRTYDLWIFRDGWFHNEGDGGWINWAFTGSFDKSGGFVQFKARS